MEPPRPARLALLLHLRPVIRLARPRRLASLARCCVPWCLARALEPGFVWALHMAGSMELMIPRPTRSQ